MEEQRLLYFTVSELAYSGTTHSLIIAEFEDV